MDKDVEEANKSDDPLGALMERRKNKGQSFNSAFREAREAGDKTFYWNGKKYTTEMAKPKPRPAVSDTYRKEGEGRGTPEAPKRAVIPGTERETVVEEPTKGSRFMEGLGDTAAKGLAALGAGAGVAGLASKLSKADKAAEAALRTRDVARAAPILRRSGEAVEAERAGIKASLAKEPPLSRAASASEKAAPTMQAEKARPSPRARTREMDEMDVEFKRGGAVRGRGDGICQRGHTKGTMR